MNRIVYCQNEAGPACFHNAGWLHEMVDGWHMAVCEKCKCGRCKPMSFEEWKSRSVEKKPLAEWVEKDDDK